MLTRVPQATTNPLKEELARRGVTLSHLAAACGCRASNLSAALSAGLLPRRILPSVAAAVGWPESRVIAAAELIRQQKAAEARQMIAVAGKAAIAKHPRQGVRK